MQDNEQNKHSDFSAFEGTRPVQDKQRFDTDALVDVARSERRWLRRSADGRAVRGRPVEPDVQARHARAQLCDAREARTRRRSFLPSAHAIEREYRVMDALAATDVPSRACSRCARTRA